MVIIWTVDKQSKEEWVSEKRYYADIAQGLSKIYFQQYYLCTWYTHHRNFYLEI